MHPPGPGPDPLNNHPAAPPTVPQVLHSKEDLLADIRSVLRVRDEAYMRLLQRQTEETDALIALMAQEYDKFKRGQEQALESVEAAYLQVCWQGRGRRKACEGRVACEVALQGNSSNIIACGEGRQAPVTAHHPSNSMRE